MKHFLIKFNHGVEIGAYLAYKGHALRTKDGNIALIAGEEIKHRETLVSILDELEDKPNKWIDLAFTVIGTTIGFLCKFCPIWSLNLVASTMEIFAVFNYGTLAKKYPFYSVTFEEMARTEEEHKEYFRSA